MSSVIIHGKTGNTTNQAIRIDSTTYAVEVIDYSHHEIHAGSHYYIQGFLELGSGVSHSVSIVTPDTAKYSHFLYAINSTGICTTEFFEGVSGGGTSGTVVTILNNNRNSTKVSGMVLTSNVTPATGYVTRLEYAKWGADGFKDNIGGGSGRDDELILKRNTKYVRRFLSGAASNIIQFKASWYEHTDKTA